MEEILITLGILFFFALIGGVLAIKFKQPILLGLLAVGAIIGPNSLGLIPDEHIMEVMIEFGAILILFTLGLEFDIPKLKKIGLKSIVIAVLNSAILTFAGFSVSILMGFNTVASLFIGVILAFGSTVVIIKVLEHKGMMDRQEVPLLVAVLIIEDILAVMVITFFSGVQDKSIGLIGNIETLVISTCILIVAYILFVKLIKPVLSILIRTTESDEIITFTALAMCAGFAYFAYYLKLSPAVGAFLAGSIVASLPNSKAFTKAIEPYNMIISSFFFLGMGTLINFGSIKANIFIILILVLTVVLTKLIAFSGILYFFANIKGDKMFFASVAMFSVGEFALLVAKESTKFDVGIDLVSISAAVVAISALLMSITIAYSGKLYEPTKENLPYKFRIKMETFANYIKAASEELSLNSKYSKVIQIDVSNAAISLLIFLLTIFGWRSLDLMFSDMGTTAPIIMSVYLATLGILAISLFHILFRMKRISKYLSDIFANATNIRNSNHNKQIVTRAFAGFSLVMLGLGFPFIMFLLGLQVLFVAVSFVMIGSAFWQFHKIAELIEYHNGGSTNAAPNSFPSFNNNPKSNNSEYGSKTRELNQGWNM